MLFRARAKRLCRRSCRRRAPHHRSEAGLRIPRPVGARAGPPRSASRWTSRSPHIAKLSTVLKSQALTKPVPGSQKQYFNTRKAVNLDLKWPRTANMDAFTTHVSSCARRSGVDGINPSRPDFQRGHRSLVVRRSSMFDDHRSSTIIVIRRSSYSRIAALRRSSRTVRAPTGLTPRGPTSGQAPRPSA